MPSILTEYPFVPEDYPASSALLDISPSQMQEVAERLGMDDPSFLSRMDLLEEHLNSDMTFEQYANLLEDMPCPCTDCINNSGMSAVEYSIEFFKRLQKSWAALINVVEPYVTPPNSPIGETFPYEPFSISPTNQEMHAVNGNLDWKPSDGMDYSDMPYYNQVAGKWFDKIATVIGENSPDISGRLAKYLYPELMKRKPPKLRKDRIITNKEQHISNGNPVSSKLHKMKPNPTPTKPGKQFNGRGWDWVPNHPNLSNTETLWDKISKGENPGAIIAKTGPSNREQHAYNGNPVTLPRKGTQVPKQKGKNKSKPQRPPQTKKKWKPVVVKTTAKPRLPRLYKRMAKIESLEDRVAKRYNKFLYMPSLAPPRLGSTGNTPTKLIHGFYKRIIKMDTIDFGTNPTLGNATSLLAFINPRMFSIFSTVTGYASPVVLGLAATNSINFDSTVGGAGTASMLATDFTNAEAMKSEIHGTTSTTTNRVPARWLGGSVSIECRCPMATTAPPFIFGGLLPANIGLDSSSMRADNAKQLTTQTGAQLEQLKSTSEIQGFTGSAVFVPNSPTELLFNDTTSANDNSTMGIPLSAVPYIAMNGCPTTATVVVTVSSWFEIQQTTQNSYYGGWNLGPKVSSEDIFDRLQRRNPTMSKVIDQGVRTTSGPTATMQLAENLKLRDQAAPEPTIFEQVNQLKKEIQQLRIAIDEEEDEKYFESEYTPSLDVQTPNYSSLSKSTIDLAMSLKKSLTPGSVTNKTVPKLVQ